ncbi:MAG: sulfotransferase [Anaerolineae bacterium]|nr:sulfotransferase [Anaerolineae bacterium]
MTCTCPIIIVGHGRSGTTLLQAIVASHPDVAMFRRDPVWWRTFSRSPRYRKLGTDVRVLARLLDDLFDTPHLRDLEVPIDRQRVEAELIALSPVKFGDVVRVILDQYACNYGKLRWGLKSPGNEHHADAILAASPDALIVHLVRDPRDVLVSARSAGMQHIANPVRLALRWNRSARMAVRNRKRYSGSYLVVRFEDLVTQPEVIVREICVFLKLAYVPQMVEPHGQEAWRWRGSNTQFDDVPSYQIGQAPVGRYRRHLTPTEIAICNATAGRLMRRFGYKTAEPVTGRHRFYAGGIIAVQWPFWALGSVAQSITVRLGIHGRIRRFALWRSSRS